jgi:hypothetical protein
VNQRRRPLAVAMMIAVLAAGVSPAADAWAGDASELQEMRREVAKLRGQVQALQTVVAEATELERQRAAALTRAMKELSVAPASGAPAAAAAPPAAPAPSGDAVTETRAAPAPSMPVTAGDDKPRGSSRQRRHRRAARARSKSSSRSAASDR